MIIIDVVFVLDLALIIFEFCIIFESICVVSLFSSRVVVAVLWVSIAAGILSLLAWLVGVVSAIPRSSLVVFPISMANSIGLIATARL